MSSKLLDLFGLNDRNDYDEDEYIEEEEETPRSRRRARQVEQEEEEEETPRRHNNKRVVVPEKRTVHNGNSVVIYSPKSYNDAQPLVQDLNANKHVIVKFDKVDRKTAQRILDFMSGAAYSIDAQVSEISKGIIYLFASKNTNIDKIDQVDKTHIEAGFQLDEEEEF